MGADEVEVAETAEAGGGGRGLNAGFTLEGVGSPDVAGAEEDAEGC